MGACYYMHWQRLHGLVGLELDFGHSELPGVGTENKMNVSVKDVYTFIHGSIFLALI